MAKETAETKEQVTTTANTSEAYKFVSLEEAEKLTKYIGKSYVPKNNEDFAKKFFYKVESIIPYTPANIADPDSHLYHFMLQKYHRNKVEKVNVATDKGGSMEVERNQKVEGHVLSETGKWQCVDAQANILVDSGKFKRDYIADTNEE